MARTRRIRRRGQVSPWPFAGMAGIACLAFLYGASALVAPSWAVVGLFAVWFGLLGLAVRWWTPHPRRLIWLATGGAMLWFVVLVGGARYLGWSA